MITKCLNIILAGVVLAGLPQYASAKDDHGHKGHHKHERRWDDDDRHRHHGWYDERRRWDDDKVIIVIDSRDRDIIRRYGWHDDHNHCPRGLVETRRGCVPYGHAKKYRVGERLPDYVVYYPVEDDLRVRLSPLPVGYNYVRVDQDILLIGEATKKVIDAVTLISAVGN